MLYFREQAADLIKANEKSKIIVPKRDPEYKTFLQQAAQDMCLNKDELQILNKNLELKKYPIEHDGKKRYTSLLKSLIACSC
jgi:hypothetical protein